MTRPLWFVLRFQLSFLVNLVQIFMVSREWSQLTLMSHIISLTFLDLSKMSRSLHVSLRMHCLWWSPGYSKVFIFRLKFHVCNIISFGLRPNTCKTQGIPVSLSCTLCILCCALACSHLKLANIRIHYNHCHFKNVTVLSIYFHTPLCVGKKPQRAFSMAVDSKACSIMLLFYNEKNYQEEIAFFTKVCASSMWYMTLL